jgi:N-acetyl-gamma-glutamyl-phosphate reductase
MQSRVTVGIVGGTGYTGVELLRLLLRHPGVEIRSITSRAESGVPVCKLYPSLRGQSDLVFAAPEDASLEECDAVFFATPHGVAMQSAHSLLRAGVRIVDLSADFRLRDAASWERWYGHRHAAPDLCEAAVYGLPERNRDRIRQAQLVAAPGCYPTAVQLGFLPLLESGLIATDCLMASAASGVSGAGRQANVDNLLSECADSLKAYAVTGHRHVPEIEQELSLAAGAPVSITFVPHLAPMVRGIHATLFARLAGDGTDLQALFEERYRNEPAVDVLPPGSHPQTRSVRGSNFCRLAVHRPQGRGIVVVLVVIDNLVKGAAGQAVQAFNLMHGFDEFLGLDVIPLLP